MAPTRSNEHGSVEIIDSCNFPASEKIASAIVTVKPGGIRELHWHPDGGEWQSRIKGEGRMTLFNAQETARAMDFNASDVGFVPNVAGHTSRTRATKT